MPVSSPSPPDSTEAHSPRLAPPDLALDPADPFNFLLTDETSSMWPETDYSAQIKPYGAIDFTDLSSLPMDMDYMNTIAVEPSALQYNNSFYGVPYVDELSSAQLPFTFQVPHAPSSPSDSSSMQSSSSSTGRRLSISSSVSSLSPAPESVPSPAKLLPASTTDAAALIAERVRQSAGVMLALPMTAQLQAFENNHTENTGAVSMSTQYTN
ncbi:hypothetical protein C0993_007353 [Termitomyces sp. T159_Od127]|nr:hypothetical protein C0993_007353 [Termitomyces sp. T159_Od127]